MNTKDKIKNAAPKNGNGNGEGFIKSSLTQHKAPKVPTSFGLKNGKTGHRGTRG